VDLRFGGPAAMAGRKAGVFYHQIARPLRRNGAAFPITIPAQHYPAVCAIICLSANVARTFSFHCEARQ